MSVKIFSTNSNTLLSGTSDNDIISNGGWKDGYRYVGGSGVTITGGSGDDSIFNNGIDSKIYCGEGDDSVSIYDDGSNSTIIGGDGDEYITNYAENVKIICGNGNDSIWNTTFAPNSLIDGGDSNDAISNNGENVTIIGGKGNDSIFNEAYLQEGGGIYWCNEEYGDGLNFVFQYNVGDGKDTVYGFKKTSTLAVAGNSYSTQKSGSDMLVKVGSGSILLKNVSKAKIVTIQGGNIDDGGDDTLPAGISVKNGIVTATKDFTGNEIDLSDYGANKINAADCENNLEIIGNANRNTLRGGSGNDKLTGKGGAYLFIFGAGDDTITDYVAGTDKISVSGSYTGKISGNNVILTTDNGTLKILNGKGENLTINGVKKKFGGTSSSKTLTLTNKSKAKIELSSSYTNANASSRTKSIEIVGNSKNNSLIGGSNDDTLIGGAGKDTLTGGKGKDKFLHSTGNDVITDYAVQDTIYLIDTDITGRKFYVDDVIWTTDSGSITLKNAKNKKITYYDSDSNPHIVDYQNVTYSKNFTVLTVKKNFAGDKIDLTDYADTVRKVNASAVTDNIEIFGNAKNNSLLGGSGADILAGGEGNDTLTGDNGKDIFVHYTGDDVITDYTAGSDKIQLDNTEIVGKKVGQNHFNFVTTTGSILVKNGAGKKITVIDSDGNEIIYKDGKIISGSVAEENNFADIDEIIENKFAAAEFENSTEKISQENLITFSK